MEMTTELKQKLEDAVWAAHSLFERGKTSGSSANMSFAHDGKIYVSASGTCFGTLTAGRFFCSSSRRNPYRRKKTKQGMATSSGAI